MRLPHFPRLPALAVVLTLLCVTLPARAADVLYDVVILGGRIVDGSGAPWYRADLGIRQGKIVKLGRIDPETAAHTIDARGRVVAPGFIDMMGQTATPMLDDPATAKSLLTQGITTINAGEGASAAPLGVEEGSARGWQTMAGYFQLLELKGLPVNVVQTVGHTQVRRLVLGSVDRAPDAAELTRMKSHVREAMKAGAIGVSTALIYAPAVYATTQEIAALASVVGEFGGRYYTHLRNEGDRLLEAIDEALEIGRLAGTPVHIFHLKAAGRQNWGKMQLAIARIRAARAEGREVTADIYPYRNNGLGIAALIHPRHFSEGRAALIARLDDEGLRAEIRREMETTSGWENWFRHCGHDWGRVVVGQCDDPRYNALAGQTVAAMAAKLGEDPWDSFFHLVRSGAFALPETMTDANKILALQQPFVSFCTDVGPAGGARSASHPRAWGSFPRLLSHYVRDLGAISLERAVAQASSTAANCVYLYDRGRIAEGLAADVVVLDYEGLADQATFAEPHLASTGVRHVIVGGELVLENGELTGRRPGRVLRGPGYDPSDAPHAVTRGETRATFAEVDQVVQDFIREHRAPGVSLAIADRGRLVYARGFGYADVGSRQPVTPASRFRIASISKPFTAAAVLKLVDEKKLSLDDHVFEILDVEPFLQSGAELDARQEDITLRHLLQHRGGWDRSQSFDAMFRAVPFAKLLSVDPPADPAAVIRVLRGMPLDFTPGERYAYSNYGYCLLGRVIEKISGQSYEDYVQRSVLEPLGIKSMAIGRTRLPGRAESEVRYYDPWRGASVFAENLGERVPQAYGAWHLEAMDSHGAWIASAADLLRFASAFDAPDECPILSSESVTEMFERPEGRAGFDKNGQPKSNYYALGWAVSVDAEGRQTTSHGGSLPGTSTLLLRRPDQRHVAILFNTRVSPHASRVASALKARLIPVLERIESWPEDDLFEDLDN